MLKAASGQAELTAFVLVCNSEGLQTQIAKFNQQTNVQRSVKAR